MADTFLIDVFLRKHRICVRLNPQHPNYQSAYFLVRSLLSSYEVDANVWTVSFNDFILLRKNCDLYGLKDGRTVTEEAISWFSWLQGVHDRNRSIKDGAHNASMRAALFGKLKTELYEDQYPAVALAFANRRWGIFDEMGSGKTISALAAIVALGAEARRVLVICPYTVQIGFVREIRKHTSLRPVVVPAGRAQAAAFIEQQRHRDDWDIMLIHPESLISTGTKSSMGEVTKLLRQMCWDVILVDEFHQYKNLSAKRTRCVISLLSETVDHKGKWPRALLLTGTPVSESPINAYVALKILSRDLLPHITKFENHFIVKQNVAYGSKTFSKVTGHKNLDELKTLLNAVSIRRTKSEMTGFPDKMVISRSVELSGVQLSLYKALCGEIVADLPRDSRINIFRFLSNMHQVLRLRQVMNSPSLLDEGGDSAKYAETDNLLEEILADPESKVVIWTEFRKAVENLFDRYDPVYGAVKIYGGISNEELTAAAVRFEGDDAPRVAVCIPAKAGTGVDFLARARTAIFIDRPYSYTLYSQAIDRIHRRVVATNPTKLDIIRSKPANIIFLDVVESVDELIRDRLIGKQDLVDALSDKSTAEISRDDLMRYFS